MSSAKSGHRHRTGGADLHAHHSALIFVAALVVLLASFLLLKAK